MAKEQKASTKTLKGFRDMSPRDAIARKTVIDQIWSSARQSGFEPIDTPLLEYSETLLGTGNQETDKEVYLFRDHGDRNVGLRFDLTVPFSRYVADNLGTLVMPFKRFQVGNSYRGEKPQRGRYREFCQADFDIVGADSLSADVEVISQIAFSLGSIVPGNCTIYVNNRQILSFLIRSTLSGLDPLSESKILVAIDKLAKIGADAVVDIMLKVDGVEKAQAESLLDLLTSRSASGDLDWERLLSLASSDETITKEINRLKNTVSLISELNQSDKIKFKADLSIARGLGYYTGVVFETFLDDHPGFGSISSGGRYNGLVSRFSKQEVPGVGGSIGVDRLLAAIDLVQSAEQVQARSGVFIAIADQQARSYGFLILRQLRQMGSLSDIDLKEGKLAQQFKYADRRHFRKVVILGENEMATESFTIKDLETGEELKSVPLADLKSHVS